MVIDIRYQTEINLKENKWYPCRLRPFHPNLSVRPLAGKFYARHDFTDPDLLDESLEKAILTHQSLRPKDKYPEPLTTTMEYGWCLEPEPLRPLFNFHYPKIGCWITQIGTLIAMEDQKNPKKPFTGVAFKV